MNMEAVITDTRIEFFVPGIARPGGSKTGYVHPHTKKFVITPASKKTKPWMDTVAWIAQIECARMCLWTEPVLLTLVFYRPRPKGHYGTGRNANRLKDSAPTYPSPKPDLTKLLRATEDGLTKIIWKDDSQVCAQQTFKLYADDEHKPGVLIRVEKLEEQRHHAMIPLDADNLFKRIEP